MRKVLCAPVILVALSCILMAADSYPDLLQILPVTARAGQTIPNFKVIGTHFENFQKIECRKGTGVDKLIKMTKIVKKDPNYVVVQVEIPSGVTGKRAVVVLTSAGTTVITFTPENTFEILPHSEKKPDLKIRQITWGTTSDSSGNLARVSVQNAGGTPVRNFKIDIYLDGKKKLRYTYAPILPAGSTMVIEPPGFRIPNTKGWYTVKAIADPENKIEEESEENNSLAVPFDQPADEFIIPSGEHATYALTKLKTAPNFILKDYRSRPYTFYDYRGKPALLVLGAMWSTYMQVETAALNQLLTDYQSKGLQIFQVLYDDLDSSDTTLKSPTPELLKVWVDSNNLAFPVLADTADTDFAHSAYSRYQSEYQPMNYIINSDGTVQALLQGFNSTDLNTALDNAK